MSSKHRRPLAFAAALAALALAACGTETIDADDLATKIRDQVSAQVGVDPEQVTVECPDGIEVEEGRTFECDLTAPNGDPVIVEVTLTNDDGGFEAIVPPEQFEDQNAGQGAE
jgi:ABC-type amino acid transport substrate-binding protein